MNNYYITNKTTNKIELHFEKSVYLALTDAQKSAIKSACLFSRSGGCWVSRGYVGSWSAVNARKIADEIGLENAGSEGERLSFAEQQQQKAERAEARAERYEARADRAAEHAENLQSPIESMRGDTAFFTQPNINSSAGRAFTRLRERMFSAYERGFEEFKRSEYWRERAETARQTAKGCELKSISFCQRRIDECNHDIKANTKNLDTYRDYLRRIESGEQIKRYNGEIMTREAVEELIESTLEKIDASIDKSEYYQAMIEQQGGQQYTAENVNVGDIVRVECWGNVEVLRKGSKNFLGMTERGNHFQMCYTEITQIIKQQTGERDIKHGFKAGESYTVKMYDYEKHEYTSTTVDIVKVTADRATVRVNGGRAKAVAIRNGYNNDYYIPVQTSRDHYEWIHPHSEATAQA